MSMKVIAGCVYNDAVAIFLSSYVATIVGIISFLHTHDNIICDVPLFKCKHLDSSLSLFVWKHA